MIEVVSAVLVVADTWDMHDWGTGWWIVMMVGMLLFWGLVIVGVLWIVRELGGDRRGSEREDPRAVLKRRLAEGDISEEEYERRQNVLDGSPRT